MFGFRLISVGDRFPFVRLDEVCTRFDKAVNFTFQEQVVSVVTPEIGSGPFRIVLNMNELSSIQMVEYRAGCVILNDCIGFQAPDEKVFASEFKFSPSDAKSVAKAVKALKKLLTDAETASLLVNLLADKMLVKPSVFDLEALEQFKQAYGLLLKKDYIKAVKGFKGRGFGQTPSGDDFNTGLLMGLGIREQTEKKELSKLRSSIYSNALGKNLAVNTFLLQAYNGWYDENWKALLTAISGRTESPEAELYRILAQGETSGADTLTGFLAAWEMEI